MRDHRWFWKNELFNSYASAIFFGLCAIVIFYSLARGEHVPWHVVLAGVAIVALSVWDIRNSRQQALIESRRQNNQCLTCGYDLRGQSERCPECGTGIGVTEADRER